MSYRLLCPVVVPPEATPVGESEIVLIGSNVTLTSFLPTIYGNPIPSVSWIGPDGLPRNTSGRFDTKIPGEITIANTRLGDNGTYTCTVSNRLSPNKSQNSELIFAGKYNWLCWIVFKIEPPYLFVMEKVISVINFENNYNNELVNEVYM